MDESTSRLLYLFTDLIAPLVVGYFLKQKNIVSDKAITRMIRVNIICIFTTLSLLSFWVLPLTRELAIVPLYGFLFILFPGAVGLLTGRRFHNLLDRGSHLASAMLSNIGSLGGVCAFILFDEQGFAYAQLIGTCQNIMLVLLIFPMSQYFYLKQHGLKPPEGESRLRSFCRLFFSWNQISLLGMTAGLLFNGFGIERPTELSPVFQGLVHFNAWISMLPVGFMTDLSRAKKYLRYTQDLTVIRFILVPAFICATSRLIFTDEVILDTFIILAAAPTAINAVLASKLYHLRVDLAISSFISTTAMYLLIIFPALFFLLK